MKKIFLFFVFLLLFYLSIYAESEDTHSMKVGFLPIDLGEYEGLVDSIIITTQKEYDSLIAVLQKQHTWLDEDPLEIDFGTFDLVCDESWADCVASFSYKVLKDTLSKQINITITEHYGGGRGMSDFHHWFLIQKIPQDYTIHFIHKEGKPKYPYGY